VPGMLARHRAILSASRSVGARSGIGTQGDFRASHGYGDRSCPATPPSPPPNVNLVRPAGAAAAAALAAAPSAALCQVNPTTQWLLESCVPLGSVSMGLPGLAAQYFFLSPLTTMSQIRADGTVGSRPLLPYSAMFVNGSTWVAYGLLAGHPAIWLANVPGALLGAAYFATYVRYCPPGATHLPGTVTTHYLGAVAFLCAVAAASLGLPEDQAATVVGLMGNVIVLVMFGGPLSAMKQVIKTQSTAALALPVAIATVVNCSLWTTYGALVTGDPYIWFPNSVGALFGIAQLALFARYGIHR